MSMYVTIWCTLPDGSINVLHVIVRTMKLEYAHRRHIYICNLSVDVS